MIKIKHRVIRYLDIVFSITGLVVFSPILLPLIFVDSLTDKSILFRQERLGKNKRIFTLYKIRTMKIDTKSLPSHMVDITSVTSVGKILRKFKIDELPQLFNVLEGSMSFVGPRPCLKSQEKLIIEREKYNVFDYKPGITGLAQINCIDMSKPELLAKTDSEMMKKFDIKSYFIYIFKTVIGAGFGDRVRDK